MDLKEIVLNNIEKTKFKDYGIEKFLTCNAGTAKGDVSLPCFPLAKMLGKSPIVIAQEIESEIDKEDFEKIEVVNGYLNFYIKKSVIIKDVCDEVCSKKENYGKQDIGQGKVVVSDYSSPNLAKYLHIGHLKTTIIGDVLKRIYSFLGYKTVGINYVGDFGLPFGKMLTAYKHWGNDEEIKTKKIDAIQDLYVKFHVEEEKDPGLLTEAQMWTKKIEEGDQEASKIYKWFVDLSIEEANRIYDLLDIKFDVWRGESYYNGKMEPILKELTDKGFLITSEGAKGVDLSKYNLGFCLFKRSDGVSLYATRDITAVEDRYNTYHFDKAIYITDVAQKLHFAQWFKCVELLGKPYAGHLQHVAYGRYSLTTGKIASRMGKQALIADLYDGIYERALEIVKEKGYSENAEEVARKITLGALRFETVKSELIKDAIFNPESAMSFEGESSPYMQYTFARCCSIISKCGLSPKQLDEATADVEDMANEISYSIIKHINNFAGVIKSVHDKTEPFLLTQYLLELCSLFNKYYNAVRIIENGKVNVSRAKMVEMVRTVLADGLTLLGIPLIEKM